MPISISMRCREASSPICSNRPRPSASAIAGTRSCRAYADVNHLLGDIVKVTPTSKAVGDLALLLVTNGMQAQDLLSDSRELAFPESVLDLVAGRMGQPPGGFPAEVVKRIVRGGEVVTGRPGESCRRPTSRRPKRRPPKSSAGWPRRGGALVAALPAGVPGFRRPRDQVWRCQACCPRPPSSKARSPAKSWP